IDSSGRVANPESYQIVSNTILASGSAPGVRVVGTAGAITVANNLVTVVDGPALRIDAIPGGGLIERNNLWWRAGGSVALGVAGATYTSLTTYQAATGRGSGDKIADPMLGSDGAPGVGSPAIDAGAALAGYVGDCTGAAWHYCGSAPDLGAVERSVASPPPPPPPPPPPVAAPVLTITSPTIGQ